MKFTILPLQGTDKLKLNLTSEEIKNIFPNEYCDRFKKGKTPTDDFSIFHVYYDENGKSKAIEFWEEAGRDYNEVRDMFEKLDNNP